ncbi:MAG: class I SAM-dependent methyltransferase [Chthoniobacterales bacterium]|nr:class I SAM-dependent methyltransferase [Chthoniobacterales bacterium]
MNCSGALFSALSGMQRGRLRLVLPDGSEKIFGGLGEEPAAEIRVTDAEFFRRCVLFGPVGFGEAYMDGLWTTPDLVGVISWFIRNADDSTVLEGSGRTDLRIGLFNLVHHLAHRLRPNSLRTSRRNIAEHYDLSNDFFKLWLDPTMTYSCAYWDKPGVTLEEAQTRKYDVLCRKLRLQPSDSVLEIGSGWGGFAMHAAKNFGCRVTTVTISRAQYEEAGARIVAAGLGDRIDLRLTDYRELRGCFDKIASIEMLEAVGDRYLEPYFAQCHRLLDRRGLLGLQYITCPDAQFDVLRRGVDFIQRHVFPGSLLLSVGRVNRAINRTGDLFLHDLDDMGPYYAKTLHEWRANFWRTIDAVRAQGFDDTFVRKWDYYLAYCEAAFATRHISVLQAVYTRANNDTLNRATGLP